FRRPSVHL
ncbi:hypothetical protein BN1723_019904, partial [Verticillium longisporum]